MIYIEVYMPFSIKIRKERFDQIYRDRTLLPTKNWLVRFSEPASPDSPYALVHGTHTLCSNFEWHVE